MSDLQCSFDGTPKYKNKWPILGKEATMLGTSEVQVAILKGTR